MEPQNLTLSGNHKRAARGATTSIEHAAERIGIGRSLAYRLARAGTFPVPVIRAGRRLLVPIAPLEYLLSGNTIGASRSNTDSS
jgi:hypothetical protein